MLDLLLPLLAFAAAAAVLTATPGVDCALVLRTSALNGWVAGVAASLGICLGLMAWGAGAAFGLTAVLAASPTAFAALKWAGAAYLLALGIRLLLRPRSSLPPDAAAEHGRTADVAGAFRRGLLTNLLNPKVGIFYVTFLPQFIPHGVAVAPFSLALAGVHVLLSVVWFALLIAMTVPLGRTLSRPRVVQALDRLTGAILVGFGVKLALTRLA